MLFRSGTRGNGPAGFRCADGLRRDEVTGYGSDGIDGLLTACTPVLVMLDAPNSAAAWHTGAGGLTKRPDAFEPRCVKGTSVETRRRRVQARWIEANQP